MGHVPVIDLSAHQDSVVSSVRRACESSGFFLIRNHGVLQSVINASFAANAAFFAFPEEIKAKIKVNELNRWIFSQNFDASSGNAVVANVACACCGETLLERQPNSTAGDTRRFRKRLWILHIKRRETPRKACTLEKRSLAMRSVFSSCEMLVFSYTDQCTLHPA